MKPSSVTSSRIGCLLAAAAFAPTVHCAADPVHDAEVAALGNETPGIPVGQFHRAGQPCTVCHGPEGPASTQFSLAGTVFDAPATPSGCMAVGLDNVQILPVDDNGTHSPAPIITNCVGNFFVTPDMWNPAFPVNVAISKDGMTVTMSTQISRASSCSECHVDPPGSSAVGHVYLGIPADPANEMSTGGCPVTNVLDECAGGTP
jgi:hypothetical protein